MKMKSKFFGFTAKLAMAILAVGTMFTSCYDSENGDVTKPYVAPDPVYLISGTITDVETGAAITDATITVNGTAPTQYSDGIFSASGKGGVLNTVTVKKAGYNEDATVTREFTIAALDKGQSSTTVVNIALKKNGTPDPDFDLNKVTMTVTTKMRKRYLLLRNGLVWIWLLQKNLCSLTVRLLTSRLVLK